MATTCEHGTFKYGRCSECLAKQLAGKTISFLHGYDLKERDTTLPTGICRSVVGEIGAFRGLKVIAKETYNVRELARQQLNDWAASADGRKYFQQIIDWQGRKWPCLYARPQYSVCAVSNDMEGK